MTMTKHEKTIVKSTGAIGCLGVMLLVSGYYNGAEARKSVDRDALMSQSKAIEDLSNQLSVMNSIKTKIPVGQKDFECLALNAFNEAGNYKNPDVTRADIFLISSTVINRSKEWGGSICDQVYSKEGGVAQYSWTIMPSCGGSKKGGCFPKSASEAQRFNASKWEKASKIAQSILSGGIKPITNIKWYNNPKASDNSYHINNFRNNKFSVYTSIGGVLLDGSTAQHAYYYEASKTNKEALLMFNEKMKESKQ
ncbi:spore cortex-lytic enzyme [Caudoviricetes sp.]|nr:spore cortex-lytic enzyme [Caudoviricetes sp.]